MGEDVAAQEFSRADRTRHREKVRRNLDVFARMLREARFDTDDPMTGLEVELNLIDEVGDPALRNTEALQAIADPDFQTELGRFNIEINVPPARLREGGLTTFEESLRASLNNAEERAATVGAHQIMIGILPTLTEEHLGRSSISSNPRYALLNDQILDARGEDITISIAGREQLKTTADSIVPEAACTSTQLHLQTSPANFAAYWNASQAIAGVQLAVSANSPYLLGRELWRETRIPLFEQATDTRSEELKAQGVRPRVWFGERWITSVFDLFEENVRYFPALLPVADTIANAALWFGLVRFLAESERPLWSQMSFSAAEENFHVAAQMGVDAQVYWPGVGQVRATELVLRRLLPMAQAGLDSWGVPAEESDRYLGIIEQRCLNETSGAAWFVERVRERGGDDRYDALRATLLDYRERMHSNEPVHLWD